jgi:hypothetical protein
MFSYHSWIVVLIFSLRYGTTYTCCPSVANPPLRNKHTSAKKGGFIGKWVDELRNRCSTASISRAEFARLGSGGWHPIA